MKTFLLVIVGLSGGALVGAGMFAFFIALGVIERVIDIGRTEAYRGMYKIAILLGSLLSTLIYMFRFGVRANKGWLLLIGLPMGIFVGMIASALTEVLNVIPFLSIRIGIIKWAYLLIIAIILGKVLGSILYWGLLKIQ